MRNQILIIGNHPIRTNLAEQYHQRGDEVVFLPDADTFTAQTLASISEIVLLADDEKTMEEADNEVMCVLRKIAEWYAPDSRHGKRLLCHLLLRSQSLLHMIRLEGFCKEIEEKLEVNPFTIEDQWSQNVSLHLDREPITKQSDKTVHLVLFGMSQVAEQVAINAAHVCHFPNYLQQGHQLRTRITVIDDEAIEKSNEWIQRYKHLFDNSYYRFIDTRQRPAVIEVSRPMYQEREDFVDVEWEFVSASPYDRLVREKLTQWSMSQLQLLSIVFANQTNDVLNDALHLPAAVVDAKVPVYVYMRNDDAYCQMRHSDNTPCLHPFGMVSRGYDVNIPLVKMAKTVNYIYDRCYEENDKDWNGHLRFAVEIDAEKRDSLWTRMSGAKRMSNIYNAMTIGVKMRSMGFQDDEWDKVYDMSQEEMETLAEVEHNRWSVEELILGWRPCNDEEQRAVEADVAMKEQFKKRKIHYDLRAYNDLRPDGTGRPVQVYDRCLSACIPLIAKESKGGER